MECVELAPAFEPRHTSDSGSKLHALHTLRETRPPLSSVCAICSVSPENLRKKTRFSPILFSAPRETPRCEMERWGQTRPTRPTSHLHSLACMKLMGTQANCGCCCSFSQVSGD